MKIAICDDDIHFLKEIKDSIIVYSIQKNIEICVAEFTSVDDLMVKINDFDIVFLDIRFNGKSIGIEWAKQVRSLGISTLIIICSSLKDKAISAFEAEAIRFILKPISQKIVSEALDACRQKMTAENTHAIIVKSEFGKKIIRASKINYIESVNRQRKIFMINDEIVITGETLQSLQHRLGVEDFVFTHKCFLVPIAMVDFISNDGEVYLMKGNIIPLSRSHAIHFKNSLINYMRNKF